MSTQLVISGIITLLVLVIIFYYIYPIYLVVKVFKELEINISCLFICCSFCFLRYFSYSEDNHDCYGFYLNKNGDCFWKCCCCFCSCCKNCVDIQIPDDSMINNEDDNEVYEVLYILANAKYYLIKNMFTILD